MSVRQAFAGVAWALLFGASAVAQESAPVQAVWQPQELTFHYQSFTTFYSCDSLENKLQQMLRQVGAEAIVRVRSAECGRGPVRLPRAEIQLISPVPATPKALAALKEGESTRELVARITGDRERMAALTEQFPAQWQRVEIGRGPNAANLEGGDCELVDQFRRRILPELSVRVLDDNTPCPPNSPSLTRPTLVVEALIEMPKPDEAGAAD